MKNQLTEILTNYGPIYGTRKSFIKPTDWGVAVEKGDKIYLHITNPDFAGKKIEIKDFPYQLAEAFHFESGKKIIIKSNQNKSDFELEISKLNMSAIDNIIVLKVIK